MKKILVLEDNPNRIAIFKTHLVNHDVDYVDIAWDANKLLNENIYDIIYLDHDLGGHVYVVDDDINGTGYDVAKVIPETENKNARIIIHTYNPVGYQRMSAALNEYNIKYAYVPFGLDTISIAFDDDKWK